MKLTCLTVVAVLSILTAQAQVVLFDNTSSTITGSETFGRQSLNVRSEVAQSFTTPATPIPQTEYTLLLPLSPIQPPPVGGRFVGIFFDGNGLWDDLPPLYDFTRSTVPVTVVNGTSYATYTGNFTLMPSTTYWIHIFNYGDVSWSLTGSPVFNGLANPGPWARQENNFNNGPWVPHTESQLMMQLTAVPEPIHASLLAGSLLGIAAMIRTYRRGKHH